MDSRILVADDNPINLLVAGKILKTAGYQVDIVCGGKEAVKACVTKSYGLILMDCQMPEMDGLTATQHIRRLEMTQPVIIAVTALSLREAQEQCMDDMMNGYLRKPYYAEQLLQLVREKLRSAPPVNGFRRSGEEP